MHMDGVYTALVTPFAINGSIDEKALHALIERQESAGITGLVLAGTTGEAITFSEEEFSRVLSIGEEHSLPIIAGIGSASTAHASRLAHIAEQHAIDALMLVMPYYNKPMQEGMFQHCMHISASTERPIVLYNVPSRTGCSIAPETVARLYEMEPARFIGIKEASADMCILTKLRSLCGDNFSIFSGDDATAYPAYCVGANGIISVSSNLLPNVVLELFTAWQSGDSVRAEYLHRYLFDMNTQLFMASNPIPVKKALHYMGYIEDVLRLPLTPLGEEYSEKLHALLRQYNCI